MFRRGFGRPFRRGKINDIPPALIRANRFLAEGKFLAAAEIFEQFARGAQIRNGPRAPWFFLQAGHARLLAKQTPAAMMNFRQGLAIFAARGQYPRLFQAVKRTAAELKQAGFPEEVREIEAILQNTLPAGFVSEVAPAGKAGLVLPTQCTGCGAPILSDQVEWVDEVTAECPYCGSAVRAE